MLSKCVFGGLLAAMLTTTALAQSQAPAAQPAAPATTASAPMAQAGHWRSSKLIGVNVYNDQNEKLGDINEILLDQSGKVAGVVLGVGGFLGMGEHFVMVSFDKLKWVNEPVRTSTTTPPAENSRPLASSRPRLRDRLAGLKDILLQSLRVVDGQAATALGDHPGALEHREKAAGRLA